MFEYETKSWEIILETINRLYSGFDAKIVFMPPARFENELALRTKDGSILEEKNEDAFSFTYLIGLNGVDDYAIVINDEVDIAALPELIIYEAVRVIVGTDPHTARRAEVYHQIYQAYIDTINKPEEKRDNWVIVLQSHYYYSNSSLMELDFYKAGVFINRTAGEMDEFLDSDTVRKACGKSMRRAVLYTEAEQEYLARQREEQKKLERWELLDIIIENFPDACLKVAFDSPRCEIKTMAACVKDILRKMNGSDFAIVDVGDINKRQFVLEIIKKKKVFAVAEIQDALANIAVDPGFTIQFFVEELLDDGAIATSVDGKYAVKNAWLIENQKDVVEQGD